MSLSLIMLGGTSTPGQAQDKHLVHLLYSHNVLFLLGKTGLILNILCSHAWQALHPHHLPWEEAVYDFKAILQIREQRLGGCV